ncbi:glycosyltransferase family 2 protein [Paenibacillus sp. AR247]|uniref:glycosyltransferase n=1 Tax=Paenibacillus sp. AR247 TaxID=1631599 RepID=UPI000CF9D4C6|nr:glycosyltransferase family A protein [Paenibacillus sp. AR247]PQP85625.1 glycosyl transferase family 2 [Paenibacillus sp. AR247]
MKVKGKFNTRYESEAVSVITCTNRPNYFKQLLTNYTRQKYKTKELIIILNNDSMNLAKYQSMCKSRKDISIYQRPAKKELGSCLNDAIRKARYEFIARFDDDDYYSPYYLNTMMDALVKSKADIVGKRGCLVYLEADSGLFLRYPEEQMRHVKQVSGATLLCRKQIFNKVRFRSVSLGETVGFLKRCHNKGFRIYSADCYHYVIQRRAEKKKHTWKISDQRLKSQSRRIRLCGSDYRRYAVYKD